MKELKKLPSYLLLILLVLLGPTSVFGATFSSTIQNLSGTLSSATIGSEISFRVLPSGDSGAVTYTLSDSFSGTSLTNSKINENGIIYWTPTIADAGTHNITINMVDQAGNTGTAYQQVIVPSPLSITIENLSPSSSVNVNQTIFFTTRTTGFTSATYSVSDSNSNSSITPGSVNSSGNFSWTPKDQDVGGHTITVTATNSDGRSVSASQGVTIGKVGISLGSLSPSDTVMAKQNVSFVVTPTGFTSPTYLATDSFSGYSVGNITGGGVFNWTPTINDFGIHTITVRVNDASGNTAEISQKITVTKASATISGAMNSTTTKIGSNLTFGVTTTGFTNPTYIINDSFSGTSLSTKNIDSSGILNWIPTVTDTGTHSVSIKVVDNSGNVSDLSIIINVSSAQSLPVSVNTTAGALKSESKKYAFTRALKVGSTGIEVSELQKKLTSLNLYSGPITGTFGPLTRTAVKKLQARYNLEQVGSVGPGTRKLLNNGV